MNLMFSMTFPAYHPRTGQQTGFVEKILAGTKIHTVRKGYNLWKRFDGKRVALNVWEGKPYRSKVVPFATAVLSVDKIAGYDFIVGRPGIHFTRDILGTPFSWEEFSYDDGLTLEDFLSWFKNDKYSLVGCACIWFDDVKPMGHYDH